jgi:hypothetical protein
MFKADDEHTDDKDDMDDTFSSMLDSLLKYSFASSFL